MSRRFQIAQSVERLPEEQKVIGAKPILETSLAESRSCQASRVRFHLYRTGREKDDPCESCVNGNRSGSKDGDNRQ